MADQFEAWGVFEVERANPVGYRVAGPFFTWQCAYDYAQSYVSGRQSAAGYRYYVEPCDPATLAPVYIPMEGFDAP